MLIIGGEKKINDAIQRITRSVINDVQIGLDKIKSYTDLTEKVKDLRETIETLKIERSRIQEEHAKREREIEHKLGLERKRQEMELELAKREAVLDVNEKNLQSERDQFEKQMEFIQERMATETGYLKDMIGEVLARLPDAKIMMNVGNDKRGRK